MAHAFRFNPYNYCEPANAIIETGKAFALPVFYIDIVEDMCMGRDFISPISFL